uniref:Putative secreted peptide n=1 Tax=Anopheles braziliensis TaxID=58242 RepID=A0A2M3ZMB2_9DIPT
MVLVMLLLLRMMMNSIFVVIAGRWLWFLFMDSIPGGEIEGDRLRDRGGTLWCTVRSRGLLGASWVATHRQERGRLPDQRRR